MVRTLSIIPERGDIWIASLGPALGDEVRKVRPVVIIGRTELTPLRLAVICPVRSRRRGHEKEPWLVEIIPDGRNGLSKTSSIDAFQVRCGSLARLKRRIGVLDDETVATVARAVAVCVGFQIKPG